jgi:hypothetical protein
MFIGALVFARPRRIKVCTPLYAFFVEELCSTCQLGHGLELLRAREQRPFEEPNIMRNLPPPFVSSFGGILACEQPTSITISVLLFFFLSGIPLRKFLDNSQSS